MRGQLREHGVSRERPPAASPTSNGTGGRYSLRELCILFCGDHCVRNVAGQPIVRRLDERVDRVLLDALVGGEGRGVSGVQAVELVTERGRVLV